MVEVITKLIDIIEFVTIFIRCIECRKITFHRLIGECFFLHTPSLKRDRFSNCGTLYLGLFYVEYGYDSFKDLGKMRRKYRIQKANLK